MQSLKFPTACLLFYSILTLVAPKKHRIVMKTNILSKWAILAFLGGFITNATQAYTPDPWERQIVAACLILEASDQGERGMIARHCKGQSNQISFLRLAIRHEGHGHMQATTMFLTRLLSSLDTWPWLICACSLPQLFYFKLLHCV